MNCKDLNIRQCYVCENNWGVYELETCWVKTYVDVFKTGNAEEIKWWFMFLQSTKQNLSVYYLYHAVKNYYPEHLDMVEKLMALI